MINTDFYASSDLIFGRPTYIDIFNVKAKFVDVTDPFCFKIVIVQSNEQFYSTRAK